MDNLTKCRQVLTLKLCKYVFCVVLPFFLIPLAVSPNNHIRCMFVVSLVITYWLLEPVHIAVTSLLPVVFYPLLGILSSKKVASCYMSETIMLFLGGLIMAVAVEECNLHERVALKVILTVGTDMLWLMLGFIGTTAFFSLWISNTAVTAMMIPIVEAVVATMSSTIESEENGSGPTAENQDSAEKDVKMSKHEKYVHRLKVALLLSVCYSANIGGTGTLLGTGTNLVMKAYIDESFPQSKDITFLSWMLYNIPGMILCLFVAWVYLYVVFVRCSKMKPLTESGGNVSNVLDTRYEQLGKISFQERMVIILCTFAVLLLVFRKPRFIPGWEDMLSYKKELGDSLPVIGVVLLFFLLPANPSKLAHSPRILDWKRTQVKLPWGIVLFLGGGLALTEGIKESGLTALIGDKLSTLGKKFSPGVLVAILCVTTSFITEVISNLTAATVILPIIGQMAVSNIIHPLYLVIPTTVSCSYAFMLPVATPPNALAFEISHMKALEMLKPGFVMNIVCCCLQLLMINTLGFAIFELNDFPDWASWTSSNSTGAY